MVILLAPHNQFKIKFSLCSRYFAETCNEWRPGEAHLSGLARGQYSSEEISQRWRAVDDALSHLIGLEIEHKSFAPIAMSLTAVLADGVSRTVIVRYS